MSPADFRSLALSLPEAVESSHVDHPDFRVGGKVFASLGPDETWGMAKLTPEQQNSIIRVGRKNFYPAAGAWGRRGCTLITLAAADEALVLQALKLAWLNTAPKKLVKAHGELGEL